MAPPFFKKTEPNLFLNEFPIVKKEGAVRGGARAKSEPNKVPKGAHRILHKAFTDTGHTPYVVCSTLRDVTPKPLSRWFCGILLSNLLGRR